ncbi:hypothetical protein E2C01_073485 [Portunus trituberculatus]|uniref:Uncharacterized protein n=1 Tax=Portunus trituberculatus TaxID=210409 RepID=A0A5B7I9U7_PORTR|nr:hypothetical protein [Portunus trituberculatus]
MIDTRQQQNQMPSRCGTKAFHLRTQSVTIILTVGRFLSPWDGQSDDAITKACHGRIFQYSEHMSSSVAKPLHGYPERYQQDTRISIPRHVLGVVVT